VKIESAVASPENVTLQVNDAGTVTTMTADWLLISAGVIPNTSGLGLETVGVTLDKRGMVSTDDHMATNVPGIYAIGDITGKLALAHVASAQGVIAAESIAASLGLYKGRINRLDYNAMPRCTYTVPQVASMGLTEAQAREQGYAVKVSKFPLSANGKSLALNNRDGFVKIVADEKYGEILGAHLVGPDVTELLPEFVLAKSAELTPDQIADAVHAHPTLSETLMEAAHGIEGCRFIGESRPAPRGPRVQTQAPAGGFWFRLAGLRTPFRRAGHAVASPSWREPNQPVRREIVREAATETACPHV
jgi:dihydrolipoamide dehydrogenase